MNKYEYIEYIIRRFGGGRIFGGKEEKWTGFELQLRGGWKTGCYGQLGDEASQLFKLIPARLVVSISLLSLEPLSLYSMVKTHGLRLRDFVSKVRLHPRLSDVGAHEL